ncbi:MAG: hypothetical protein ACXWHD_11210 [Candidatus Aminicenantales bacterium]
MRITDWRTRALGDSTEVSADIDGFRLWYRVPRSYPLSRAADPFVAAALLPAMLQGQGLEVGPGLTMSPKLVGNLGRLQEIHHCWNPLFKIVPIRAATSPAEPLSRGALAFFSGGVDSSYTFLKRRVELTHLVFVQGFDFFVNAGASGAFSAADLADLSQLALKLTRPRDGFSAFLGNALSKETLEALSDYRSSGMVDGGLESRLAGELEGILSGAPVWEIRRFSGAKLRPETTDLLKGDPAGRDLYRLNRLLVEDAYPQEIARRDDTIYRTAIGRNDRFARAFDKTLIAVSTNHYAFGYRYNLSRNLTQGSALGSVALLLGFPRVYLPAAYSYSQLIPLGSHPLTDPLWSNESVEIVHDGAEARRVDKVLAIAGDARVLANLRVCFDDMNDNGGRCAKCLRTIIPLRLLGASAAPFPPLPPLGTVKKMRIANDIEMIFFEENFDPAMGPADRALLRALEACRRRYERQQLLKAIDKVVFGGFLKKAYRRRAAAAAGIVRIDTLPPPD